MASVTDDHGLPSGRWESNLSEGAWSWSFLSHRSRTGSTRRLEVDAIREVEAIRSFQSLPCPSTDSSEEEDSSTMSITGFNVKTRKSIVCQEEEEGNVDRVEVAFKRNLVLAISVGFWVTLFGLPAYSMWLQTYVFGVRAENTDTMIQGFNMSAREFDPSSMEYHDLQNWIAKLSVACSPTDTGRIRNVAPQGEPAELVAWQPSMSPWAEISNISDIWCGYLPSSYLAYLPNVAQLIVFTVWKNTGSTVKHAWEGMVGTVLAGLNCEVLAMIFPNGGRGHWCAAEGKNKLWTVMWFDRQWRWKQTASWDWARELYHASYDTGTEARAIFRQDHSIDKNLSSFRTPAWKDHMVAMYKTLSQEDCEPGTVVYRDKSFAKWGYLVVIFDTMFVIFLFLISKANRNTILYGLSWHLIYMMDFLNPARAHIFKLRELVLTDTYHPADSNNLISSVYGVVNITTFLGCLVAIIATFVPGYQFCNLARLYTSSRALTYDITNIWKVCIDYLGGQQRSAARFRIEMQIKALSDTSASLREDLDGAWWETFDIGRRGKVRQFLDAFDTSAMDIRDILAVVKTCILAEKFTGQHNEFWSIVRVPAMNLCKASGELMWLCLEACRDGEMSKVEVDLIRLTIEYVQDQSVALQDAYAEAIPVTKDLSDSCIFIFALHFWTKKTIDLAESIINVEGMKTKPGFCKILHDGLVKTWSPSVCLTYEHVMYAIRNLIGIGVCFIIGVHGSVGIFKQYTTTMANTLVFLMAKEESRRQVDLQRILHRIFGVSVGKILPHVGVGFFNNFVPCQSFARAWMQGTKVWLYISVTVLIYFTSEMWAYIGCLMAAYGCYELLQPCYAFTDAAKYASRYQDLCAVVLAIIIQAFVYLFLSKTTAQRLMVKRFEATTEALCKSFEALFAGNLPMLQSEVSQMCTNVAAAKDLMKQCDPKMSCFPGAKPAFKMDLCRESLNALESICGELNMLVVATRAWVPNRAVLDDVKGDELKSCGVLEFLDRRGGMKSIEQDLLSMVRVVDLLLPGMFADRPEDQVPAQLMQVYIRRMKKWELDGLDNLYSQLVQRGAASLATMSRDPTRWDGLQDLHMRLMIAIRSLEHSTQHFATIGAMLVKETKVDIL